jgi:hypothetical protein
MYQVGFGGVVLPSTASCQRICKVFAYGLRGGALQFISDEMLVGSET